ncbi:MAG: adenosylcobinamide amidohydrolase [Methanoculleaceae archaeon]
MRFSVRGSTLFIRGSFRAVSTGVGGGMADVRTIFNHTVPPGWDHKDPARYLELIVAREGFGPEFFGLLTAVDMRHLCIMQIDGITAFVTAGVTNPDPAEGGAHTINIIVTSREALSPAAMVEAIITATEAKADALRSMGYDFSGTTTDAVIIGHEGESPVHQYAGSLTEAGSRIRLAVIEGVRESIRRWTGEVQRKHPSFFIYSRYRGKGFVEWEKRGEECPYYPCHFPGQRCDFCYCPFYPCKDESLGEWVESSSGGEVWNCSHCELVHIPVVADYLLKYPEASLCELKRIRDKKQ